MLIGIAWRSVNTFLSESLQPINTTAADIVMLTSSNLLSIRVHRNLRKTPVL